MRSSAAERRRPTLLDGLVVLLVLAAAGLIFWQFRPAPGNFLTATVVLNHVTVAEYPLSELTGPVTLDVPGAEYPITLEADRDRIRILHSECPGRDCVHTGWVSRDRGQIVCLPNRLVISITGSQDPVIDGVTG